VEFEFFGGNHCVGVQVDDWHPLGELEATEQKLVAGCPGRLVLITC
jgi:hypothetical protein